MNEAAEKTTAKNIHSPKGDREAAATVVCAIYTRKSTD